MKLLELIRGIQPREHCSLGPYQVVLQNKLLSPIQHYKTYKEYSAMVNKFQLNDEFFLNIDYSL